MSIKNGTTLTMEALKYVTGLIRNLANVSEGIDDLNIRSDGTFSSLKLNTLLRTLKEECNEYSENLCSNLSRLELKLVTNENDITQSNILYLFKPDGQDSYNQYVVIEGNKVLLGTCDINMTDYYTITQADDKFVLKTDYNDLVNTVNTINDTIGTETLTTTSKTVMGAINELDSKSTMVTLTQAEYNQLVADGKVDADTYYIISDDSENLDLNKFNIKTYTRLEQLGLASGCTVEDIYLALPDNSYFECSVANSNTTSGYTKVLNTPTTDGLLSIRKNPNGGNRFSLEFKVCATGLLYPNELYIGQLKGSDGTGLTWSRVCTTSVADVGKTNITSRVSNATVNSGGAVSYSVKNGICYVQIQGIATTVASNGQRIIINSNIPNPDYELTNGHYVIASPNATNGLIVFDGKGGIIYYGGAMTIYTTVSYPVKES